MKRSDALLWIIAEIKQEFEPSSRGSPRRAAEKILARLEALGFNPPAYYGAAKVTKTDGFCVITAIDERHKYQGWEYE